MPPKKESDVVYYCNMQLSDKCATKKGVLSERDFYMASNSDMFKNGRVCICKECMKQHVYVDGMFSLERFKKILMLIDYPFYQLEFESALSDKNETIGTYFKNIMFNHKGATWGDGEIFTQKTLVGDSLVDMADFEVTPELVKFWGKNYDKEEYMFLQEYYNSLVRIYDHSLPVQVNNYKNMAKTQLQSNKCLETGDMGGYEKSMKLLSMLSGDSNIKPVQENSTEKITKGGFDVFIKRIEEEEPVPLWEKDLGFADKFKYYLSIFFFGNLAKALGINNPFLQEFEEEMGKYTIDEEEVTEDAESQVDFLADK